MVKKGCLHTVDPGATPLFTMTLQENLPGNPPD